MSLHIQASRVLAAARRVLNVTAVGWGLAVMAPTITAQQAPTPQMQTQRNGDISTPYINGGVGQEEHERMRSMAAEWPLHMQFSQGPNNAFASEVNVRITDMQGRTLLDLPDAGPITYVKLPAGKYRVMARHHDRTETRDVVIDAKGSRPLDFHWGGQGLFTRSKGSRSPPAYALPPSARTLTSSGT